MRIDAGEFERGGRGGIDQTGPQPQLVRAVARPPDPHANLADFDPFDDAAASVRGTDRETHQPCPVGEPPNAPRFDRPRRAQQEVTADAPARLLRHPGKGDHAIEPIAQQQGVLRQLRQQPLRQGPLGFALAADGGGQRVVQPHFQQDRGGHLREGRPAATGHRLRERVGDLGRVDQTELRAVEGDHPPAAPKGVAMLARGGAWPQCAPHQLGKDLPRQAEPSIGPRTVGQRLAEQLKQVLGQRPGVLHHVPRERRQQLGEGHPRLAPATRRQARYAARTDHVLPSAQKAGWRSSAFVLRMCRHPQRKYRFPDKCTRGISPQRISERHWGVRPQLR